MFSFFILSYLSAVCQLYVFLKKSDDCLYRELPYRDTEVA